MFKIWPCWVKYLAWYLETIDARLLVNEICNIWVIIRKDGAIYERIGSCMELFEIIFKNDATFLELESFQNYLIQKEWNLS